MLLNSPDQLKVNPMLLRVRYRQKAVNDIIILLQILNPVLLGQPSQKVVHLIFGAISEHHYSEEQFRILQNHSV